MKITIAVAILTIASFSPVIADTGSDTPSVTQSEQQDCSVGGG